MRFRTLFIGFALFTLSASIAPSAQASGLTLGRFGGVFGHTNSEGGLGLYWNPSLTSTQPGWFATVDAGFVRRRATYDRVVLPDNPQYEAEGVQEHNQGPASTTTIGVVPYLAIGRVQPFGGVNVALTLGAYPAYGGAVEWDKDLSAPAEYPGAVDGPQRWAAISGSMLSIHYSAAAAITVPEIGISFGASMSYVQGSVETTRARNVNRGEALVDDRGDLQEGRVWLSAQDQLVTFSLGASYASDTIRLSATWRAPYTLRLTGPLTQAFATQPVSPVDSFVEVAFPHVLLTGFTVTLRKIEVTAMTDFSTWSRMTETDLRTNTPAEEMLLHTPRNMKNTLSARLIVGGDISDRVHIAGLVGIDPSATPTSTNEPGLSDALKFHVGVGTRWEVSDTVRLMFSYMEDIYTTVEVRDSIQQPPTDGTYRDSRRWLDVSFEARF